MKTLKYMDWDQAHKFAQELLDNHKPYMAIMVKAGMHMGIRWSDFSLIKWKDIIDTDEYELREIKTRNKANSKIRIITINKDAQKFYKDAFDKAEYLYGSREHHLIFHKRTEHRIPMSNRQANKYLERACAMFGYDRISTHSLRRTFGRRVYDLNPSEHQLMLLSDIFDHESIKVTRLYLGIRQEEIAKVYLDLDM